MAQNENEALNSVQNMLDKSLERLAKAMLNHVPFFLSNNDEHIISYSKYIPERCFTTYFSWELLNSGYDVFNEQQVEEDKGKKVKFSHHFDLIARKFSDKHDDRVQLKVEAKGNLESGFDDVVADIHRMRTKTISKFHTPNFNENKTDDYFAYNFNIIITQNWGIKELSDWWMNEDPFPRKQRCQTAYRTGEGWEKLKNELLKAKIRNCVPVLAAKHGGFTYDALYAIF